MNLVYPFSIYLFFVWFHTSSGFAPPFCCEHSFKHNKEQNTSWICLFKQLMDKRTKYFKLNLLRTKLTILIVFLHISQQDKRNEYVPIQWIIAFMCGTHTVPSSHISINIGWRSHCGIRRRNPEEIWFVDIVNDQRWCGQKWCRCTADNRPIGKGTRIHCRAVNHRAEQQ